ncbi:hypothetical protein FACS189413_18210 [Bacteroidia bacterium]|nr:hypothetical protein FACS189413_18210 [Bacteroidia bacterium]
MLLDNELTGIVWAINAADEEAAGTSSGSRIAIDGSNGYLTGYNSYTILSSWLCGITQNELETQFAPYIKEMAEYHKVTEVQVLEQIKKWYDGFSWDAVNYVYNLFSTLLLFQEKRFVDYWFESGSPSFLIDIIKKRNDIETVLNPFEVVENSLDAFDLNDINTVTLLFQTGYLTVKDIRTTMFGGNSLITLAVPNSEVRNGLVLHLTAAFANSNITDVSMETTKMFKQMLEGNSAAFNVTLKKLLSRIPYQLHIPAEAYYHSLMLLWLNLMGFAVEAEIPTNIGRIDAVWEWDGRVVITECKFSQTETTEKLIEQAFAQIREKKYVDRYASENKRIALLAVAFTSKEVESRMVEYTAENNENI